jgi:hypothetical protein
MKEVWSLACDTPGQKLVLLALADSEREDAGCWPSLSTLQKKCSMSRQGVLNSLAALESKGWISADRFAGKSSVYRVTIPVHAMDYLPEKKHAFQPVHAVDQSAQLTSPESGLPLVNGVDYHQSIELTGPVHRMDTNRKEPKGESKVEPESAHSPPKPKKEKPSGYTVPECFEKVDGFSAALAGWIEQRNKLRKPPTGRAIQLVINKLVIRPSDAVAALDMSTEKGWAGVEWAWFDNANTDFFRNGNGKHPPVRDDLKGITIKNS